MFVARCPKCATELDVDDADRGHRVSCPECASNFLAESPPLLPPTKTVVAAKRVSASRRWNDDSDYVNDTAIPPRHWLDREDDHGPDPLRIVRRELAWPANGLIWTGWVGFLLLIVGGFLFAINGYFDMHSPYSNGVRPIFFLAFGAVAATLGSMFFVVIASGAGQMKRVRNRGQAITTAVFGLLTLLTCTVPFPVAAVGTGPGALMLIPVGLLLALPAAGFGLWALVVLNRPEVVEAFERRKRKG